MIHAVKCGSDIANFIANFSLKNKTKEKVVRFTSLSCRIHNFDFKILLA